MRAIAWNGRGLGGPSTISQLKESIKDHLPDLLCETKKKKSFVQTVCRKLKFQNRWSTVKPNGLSGGLLSCWSENITVHNIISNSFVLKLNLNHKI